MYYFVFLIVRRSHQRMQPWSGLLAYLTPIFLCCRTPFTPALACCWFCRLVVLSGTITIWDTGRKRQRWVRRTVEVMFTLAPRDGAQVGYSMGNNVKTPFFQVPAPEYHHVISYTTSRVCLLLSRLFTVLYFSVRSPRSSALRYGLPPSMSVKTMKIK